MINVLNICENYQLGMIDGKDGFCGGKFLKKLFFYKTK